MRSGRFDSAIRHLTRSGTHAIETDPGALPGGCGASIPPDDEEETSAAEEWAKYAKTAGFVSAGGMQVVVGALVGYFIGRWIDRKLGIEGVLAIVLALLGFTAGLYQMWRTLQLLNRRTERKD